MSGSIISSSVYFLWRITTFPEIGNIDASLIGIAVTCAIFLCAYGIGSGRGNPIESSLLVSLEIHGSTPPHSVNRRRLLITPVNYTVLLHSSLHVPDLHRLQALDSFRQSNAQQARISALPSPHHGFVLLNCFFIPAIPPVILAADYELRCDCWRNNHPECGSLVSIQVICVLFGNQDHPCSQRRE